MPELDAREPHAAERLLDLCAERLRPAGVRGYILFAAWDDPGGDGHAKWCIRVRGDEIWLRGAVELVGEAVGHVIQEAECPEEGGCGGE